MAENKEFEMLSAELLVNSVEIIPPRDESQEDLIEKVIFNLPGGKHISWKPRAFITTKKEVNGFTQRKTVPKLLTIGELPPVIHELNELAKTKPIMTRISFVRWNKGEQTFYFIRSSPEKLSEKIQVVGKPETEPKSEKDEMFAGR